MGKPEEQFLNELQNLFLNRLDKSIRPLSEVLDDKQYYKIVMQEIERSEELRDAIKNLVGTYKISIEKKKGD